MLTIKNKVGVVILKRAILIIIDSLGVGYMDDVKEFRPQDLGANTLMNIFKQVPKLKLPNLEKLGIMNALGVEIGDMKFSDKAVFGRANLKHLGADSFFGHYEIMGARMRKPIEWPFSYYIDTVYEKLVEKGYDVQYVGKGLKYLMVNDCMFIADNIEAELGNVYSITGSLNRVKFEDICKVGNIVRDTVQVSRVVCAGSNIGVEELNTAVEERENRFIGINAPKCNFYNRGYAAQHKGYGMNDQENLVSLLCKKNIRVTLMGKAADIIESRHAKKIHGIDTEFIMEELLKEMKHNKEGLIAVNIQETDSAGHLQDVKLYSDILRVVDNYLGEVISNLNKEDLLIVTGDHGNDPTIGHSKHTREKVPILIYSKSKKGKFIGEKDTLGYISRYIIEHLDIR
jgi:phosphopentomutase